MDSNDTFFWVKKQTAIGAKILRLEEE